MEITQIIVLICNISVAATMFAYGLSSKPGEVLYLFRTPRMLAVSLVAMFIVTPVTALALAMVIELPLAAKVAMVTLAMSPIAPALPKKLRELGGHRSYAIGLTAAVALLSIIEVPALLEFLGRLMNREFPINFPRIFTLIFGLAIGPLLAGMIVHHFLPNWAEKSNQLIIRAASILLMAAVFVILILLFPNVWGFMGANVVLAFTLFNIIALVLGHLLGGPDRDHSIVLALSTASRHPAMALTIAAATYPGQDFAAAVVLCVLINVVTSAVYIKWQQQITSKADSSSGSSTKTSSEHDEETEGEIKLY